MTRAFPEGPAQKQAAIDRLAQAEAIGSFGADAGEASASFIECLAGVKDAKRAEQATGIAGGLILLADERVTSSFDDPAGALAFARSWIDAVGVGADLSDVPGQLILWLFDEVSSSGLLSSGDALPSAFIEIRALNIRAMNGESVSRADWSKARDAAIAHNDGGVGDTDHMLLRFAEAMAWPPATARTTLMEGVRVFADICGSVAQAKSDTTDEQRASTQKLMEELFEETAAAREADPNNYYFPDIFAERHPEVSARFVRDLNLGNGAYSSAFQRSAARSIDLIRAACAA